MLAKVWKKLLLAICIIACMYNVMYKLVSRTSLEVQLQSVQNQTSLTNMWNDDQTENTVQENSSETDEVNANTVKTESSNNSDSIVVIY